MAKEIAEEYSSSLGDLTLNSKPLINMLTMLADENIAHAEAIVEAVEKHLEKVRSEHKLPVLYLIDSIVKNVGSSYVTLFTHNIVNTFCSVFEKVDEKIRAQMFKLRQTWSDVFPAKKLYALDIRVQCIDPAWPITAPAPTPNIHVNPKFFNNPASTTTIASTSPTLPAVALDPATLDMQAQLINKHKELLELRQKKLELELLQAKAKLEEQQKQLQSVKLLSKAEVPKPVAITSVKSEDSKIPVKLASQVVAPAVSKSSSTSNSTGTTRINPVNSAMLASVRPMLRDPRLRQSTTTSPATANLVSSVAVPTSLLSTPITSNNFETVNIDDKHKVKSKSHITINLDCASNDKTSVNKAGAQSNTLTRKDPRLISNKVPGSAAGNKNKSNNGRSVCNERSPTKTKTNSAPSRKSSKSSSSRSFKSSGPEHKVAVSSNNSNDGGASSSISSKNVKDAISSKGSNESSTKSSPSSSPNKYKKKTEHSSPRSDKSATDQKRSKTSTSKSDSKSSRSRERLPGDKYEDENGRTTSPLPTVAVVAPEQRTFKGLKGSTKNRNYMRRNRDVSISPEPNKDVDLRLGAPPEKQARLQPPTAEVSEEAVKSTTVDDNPSNKDVDLRTLVVPAAVNKKRSSTEKLEASNAKKSKSSQIFDVLFGNEDVDLRQLPPVLNTATTAAVSTQAAVVRPPTPPPPIISTVSEKQETKTKESKSSFDAIRAKLANATKKSSSNARKNSEDTDMRLKQSVFSATDSAEDVLQKIIISQADEQRIKNGNLSQALVEKVLTLFETQKLQEAQRRESEEVKHNDLTNTTLTPISDDELSVDSVDFSHSDSEEDSKTTRKSDVFVDIAERVPPPAPVISQNANSKDTHSDQSKDQNKTHSSVDPRLSSSCSRLVPQNQEQSNAAWHGHHRRRRPKTHWDSPPPEPWLRPPPAVLSQAMFGPRRTFPPFIRPAGENFAPRMDAALPVVPPHILESTRTTSPPTIGSQNTKELPMADPLVLEYIEQDTMRTINIDGRPREIRYYDENAIVIMSWDDPREISFQSGTRLVTFDDKESFTLSFNDTYRDVTIGGKPHRIRLGTPTRELYIDGKWYECFFGGPGIGIEVDGQMHVVKMDGPPPHVKIGTVKRTDLVAGKINLIINARTMVPVFLDAKPQKFDIEGKIHTLRFVDALRTILINEVPFKVEFGGLPKPITVHDKKHFIRFSVLPRGIKPGYVNIANMEGHRFPSPPRNDKENSNDATAVENINSVSVNEPALPMLGKRRNRPAEHENSPDSSSRNSPIMQNSLQHLGSLDVLSSIMTSPMANSSNITGYQVDNTQDSQDGFPCALSKSNEIPGLTATENTVPLNQIPFLPSSLNINELFQKLVATGIVTTAKDKTPPPAPKPREEFEPFIKPVLFSHPETLKIRQAPLITALFSGMQCSSCGVRFPPEHSMQYSQHLDWHFRQNRRGRNSARKALCRKWYYDVTDWKNFEEIEDIEEREKNWFESQQQQQQAEGAGEDGDEEIEIPSVPADSNTQETQCEVCHDKFEQFYNEEKEEWHLRRAIREDGKTYHPLCYDDYKTSLANLTFEDSVQNTPLENSETPKEESEEIKGEDPELKEETEVKENPEVEDKPEPVKAEEDDDVIIQEPKVEQIDIDDAVGDENIQTDVKIDDDFELSDVHIKEEPIDDDGFCISNIKTEPLDHDMEDISTVVPADNTHADIVSSIDGNIAPSVTPMIGITGKIKINITKPIMTPKEPPAPAPAPPKEQELLPEAVVDSNEPLPPGEEPVQLNLKPALQGLTLTKQPPVSKGTELTGLCSIM